MSTWFSASAETLHKSPDVARRAQGLSLRSFLASLITSAAIFAVELLLYYVAKDRVPQLYKPLSLNASSLTCRRRLPVELRILRESGLDAFFFLQYLRMLLKIFIFLATITLPAVVPLNLVGKNDIAGGNQGLDRFTWSNVGSTQVNVYWMHLTTALVGITFICYTVHTELASFVQIRQLYLSDPARKKQPSARTILVTDIPKRLLNERALRWVFDGLPGGVSQVWILRDTFAFIERLDEQARVAARLETVETALMRKVIKTWSRGLGHDGTRRKGAPHGVLCTPWDEYVTERKLRMMRLPVVSAWIPPIPLLGRRVNAIEHLWAELTRVRKEVRTNLISTTQTPASDSSLATTDHPPLVSALIEFKDPQAAHLAGQVVLHNIPLQLIVQDVGGRPDTILWKNLGTRWWLAGIRMCVVFIMMCFVTLVWAIPVSFTGFLSQLTALANVSPLLSWLNLVPTWLAGFVQGVLPQLILTFLTLLLPMIIRKLVACQRLLTTTAFEISVQRYYFTVLFVQNVLTVSLSTSVTAIVQDVVNGLDSVPALVARNLPKASNYFFSYLAVQGFSVSASVLLQLGGLASWLLLAPVLDHTPRDRWNRQKRLHEQLWGTSVPLYTTLACIGIMYSIISPLILVFSIAAFGLFWLIFRQTFFHIGGFQHDTGGLLYPTAINQLFMGLYLMELCLLGLFMTVRNDRDMPTGIYQGVIMAFATVVTFAFQVNLNVRFASLGQYLPLRSGWPDGDKTLTRQSLGPSRDTFLVRVRAKLKGFWTGYDSVELQESVHDFVLKEVNQNRTSTFHFQQDRYGAPELWIPKDDHGLSDKIVQNMQAHDNVKIMSGGATIDALGRITVSWPLPNSID